ncbi:MAG: hypothetical protein ACLQDM_25005 [Bradyrhizobium sp.]
MPQTVDKLIREAAALPLRDAAYAIWRQKIAFERLEGRLWPRRDYSTPEAAGKSSRESQAQIKYEHDFAQDGPTFDRLRRAHPRATDVELKQAIIAAVKFDDDCFRYFSYGGAEDYWEMCIRAVERAAKDNPPYLETTYRDARNHVAYCMK